MHIKSIILVTGLYCMAIACTAQQKTAQPAPLPAFDMEGHRGARGLMPENTIPAMYKAIDLGVTTLEMDCMITKDSQVILSHNHALNPLHTLEPDGSELDSFRDYTLFHMPYPEIKRYDVGSKIYTRFPRQQKLEAYIPLLSDLIDSVEQYLGVNNKAPVFYNIETKYTGSSGDGKLHPGPEVFVDLLMQVIIRKQIAPRVIIQSFDVRTLQALHKKYPNVRTSLLVATGATVADNLKKLGFVPDIYSPTYTRTTPAIIRDCKARNMKVIVWTINNRKDMDKFRAWGVDGIISDYPDLFTQQ